MTNAQKTTGVLGTVCLGVLILAGPVAASEAEEGGLKKYGVIHNIASDRQVERVGGIYEPEGLDKYVQRKFDEVYARLDELENRLAGIEKSIEAVKSLAEEIKAENQKTTQVS